MNGVPAPLLYAGPNQINFQVPWETAMGNASVVVSTSAGSSLPTTVNVVAQAPGIFTYTGNRSVVQNQDYSLNGPNNGALPGQYVIVYITGAGAVTNTPADGEPALGSPLSHVKGAVSVTIGATPANVAFAGLVPGLDGLVQLNVQIPNGVAAGDYPLQVGMERFRATRRLITISQ